MPRLHITALWKRLAQGQIDPCYFFCGEETYLMQEYIATLAERVLDAAPRDFNYDILSTETDTLEEALSLARTLPMMATHRVVVLHGLQQLRKNDWPSLERYLEQPSSSTALICSSNTADQKKAPAALWQRAVTVECQRLEGTRLQEWAAQTVAQRGYHLAPAALRALLHDQAADLQTIKQEIEKLCTYAGDNTEISLTDIQAVTQSSRLHSIFALSDALGARQVGPAFTLIEHLLDQGEPPLVILSLMVRHVRLLWSSKQLGQQRYDTPAIAKALGLPLTVCRQLVAQSQHFSPAHLREMYTAALEADRTFKSTNKPPQAILEALILQVCMCGATLAGPSER
jgi:DNA polymerase-3 subunit delta